jgi:hypothetical protein
MRNIANRHLVAKNLETESINKMTSFNIKDHVMIDAVSSLIREHYGAAYEAVLGQSYSTYEEFCESVFPWLTRENPCFYGAYQDLVRDYKP